jgi:hypothetical protein
MRLYAPGGLILRANGVFFGDNREIACYARSALFIRSFG